MTRDFDLIRDLLIQIEQDKAGLLFSEDDDGRETVYQLRLLLGAGYLQGSAKGSAVSVMGLTWEGHDFLDAIKDDTVWKRTKDKVKSTVGSATAEVIKAVAEGIAKSMIGM